MPLAVDVEFCASGLHEDSLDINLFKHLYCSLFNNSLATSFADTCIKGGLSVYTTGIAGVGDVNCAINTAIKTANPPIIVFLLIGYLLISFFPIQAAPSLTPVLNFRILL